MTAVRAFPPLHRDIAEGPESALASAKSASPKRYCFALHNTLVLLIFLNSAKIPRQRNKITSAANPGSLAFCRLRLRLPLAT
jgi:hypothetical protein